MAFSSTLGDRQDEIRFRNPQSPRDETQFPPITSPLRGVGSQMQGQHGVVNDSRATLHRRFTTNTVPTLQNQIQSPLSPIGQQRRMAAEPAEFTTATYHKLQVLEKKKLEYEYLREQRRRFEAEMELLDHRFKAEGDELSRLSSEMGRASISSQGHQGHQSEPTTPPEFRDGGFPNQFSRPGSNRFSLNSALNGALNGFTSPPTMSNRQSRSGSQLTAPPSGSGQSSQLPSKSMPGSRRGSDEESDDHYDNAGMFPIMSPARRPSNRLSMPVTSQEQRGRQSEMPDLSSVLGHLDTTNFLFRDDEAHAVIREQNPAASPDASTFLQMNTNEDKFPVLVRHERDGSMHYALDLATSQSGSGTSDSQSQAPSHDSGWNPPSSTHRHHAQQLSLPMNSFSRPTATQAEEYDYGTNGTSAEPQSTPKKSMNGNRHSMDVKFSPFNESKRSSYHSTTSNGVAANGVPKLQSSYSANDIPTLKNGNGTNGAGNSSNAFNTHAEQHLHNHNASLGRKPNNRLSQEYNLSRTQDQEGSSFNSLRGRSNLHASAAPFSIPVTASQGLGNLNGNLHGSLNGSLASTTSSVAAPAYGVTATGYGYTSFGNGVGNGLGSGMNMLSMGLQGMHLGHQMGMQQPGFQHGMYPPGPYNQYGPGAYQNNYGGQQGPFRDSQARVIQSRRMQNDANRFAHLDLMTMSAADIYQLCKDQHGCRFLQKKLEERNPEYLEIIFRETNPYVIELMTDPFGNYLCQKLLEFTNDEQRTVLVQNAAPAIVTIALNQHGTRALQKMIEFISTPEQIDTIIKFLSGRVVHLIQDLNGNHVIQKCLNHLKSEDAQFIFDAVGEHCVVVGTHRHGCCVLQRCIDHASGYQKVDLVRKITANSIQLVQDPFGNYVVQYILDLNELSFTRPLCLGFHGQVCALSRQKFSSNVIEKCIRVADPETKRIMIEELLRPDELEKLLRDSFANYVIQTALEYAPPDQTILLVDAIRPHLALIRQTPYGRRIQAKVQEREIALGRISGPTSGQVSPHSISASQSPPMPVAAFTGHTPRASGYQSPPQLYATANNGYGANIASPQPHRMSNPPLPHQLQNTVSQSSYQLANIGASNGNGNFF